MFRTTGKGAVTQGMCQMRINQDMYMYTHFHMYILKSEFTPIPPIPFHHRVFLFFSSPIPYLYSPFSTARALTSSSIWNIYSFAQCFIPTKIVSESLHSYHYSKQAYYKRAEYLFAILPLTHTTTVNKPTADKLNICLQFFPSPSPLSPRLRA